MLITVTGPSGIGKGVICQSILESISSLREIPWYTTRCLRIGEESSDKRFHVSLDEFDALASAGKLALVQNLYGNWYGIESRMLDVDNGFWLTELHVDNAIIYLDKIPRVLAIALVPSDLGLLGKRLQFRSTETKSEIRQRLKLAEREIDLIKRNSHIFSVVFEVAPENEKEICVTVVSWIRQQLKEF